MRRKPGTLLPLELDILDAGVALRRGGAPEFHGFQLAKQVAGGGPAGPRALTGHGTLYKALQRLEAAGLLASRWEDAGLAAAEGRPRRRLYEVTGAGVLALAAARTRQPDPAPRPGLEPT
jgi:PadR family transcriptional regulator, regulatory protein PadR